MEQHDRLNKLCAYYSKHLAEDRQDGSTFDVKVLDALNAVLHPKPAPVEPVARIGVALLLFAGDSDKILVGERLSRHEHMKWGCPGGKVEYGHSLQDTVLKELYEETGLGQGLLFDVPKPLGLLSNFTYQKEGVHFLCLWYVAHLTATYLNREITIEKAENGMPKVRAWHWINRHEMENYDMMRGTVEAYEYTRVWNDRGPVKVSEGNA